MSRAQLTSTVEQNSGGAVAPYVAGKNAVINGGMDIWQRGTSFTASTSATNYTADRWALIRGANPTLVTCSRQTTNDTTNLPFIQYCTRIQRTAASATTDVPFFATSLETVNSIPFAGKIVSFSFYARAGSNYSATSNVLNFQVISGTGTDQNIWTGFTGAAAIINSTATLTTTWQRFTFTGTVASSVTQLGTYIYYTPTGTAGANDYFEITGVQLEIGSVATPFSRAGGTLQGELAACYRYFQKFGGTQVNESFPYTGFSYSTTQGEGPLTHKCTMRTTPSLAFSTLKISDVATYNLAVTNLTLTSSGSGPDASYLVFTVASGTSSGKINYMRTDASTAGYIYLSAEL
jgi:hypothetical protein